MRLPWPSFISLHSALSFYGLIPEAVSRITSVTARKTIRFMNAFGTYSYKSVRSDLMFGYTLRSLGRNRSCAFATREKALLDLLYLYPFYDSPEALLDLRLDEDILHTEMNWSDWEVMTSRFQCKALEKRAQLLTRVYDIWHKRHRISVFCLLAAGFITGPNCKGHWTKILQKPTYGRSIVILNICFLRRITASASCNSRRFLHREKRRIVEGGTRLYLVWLIFHRWLRHVVVLAKDGVAGDQLPQEFLARDAQYPVDHQPLMSAV